MDPPLGLSWLQIDQMAFKPGQSGNPSGRRKLSPAERKARQLAQDASPDAVQALIDLIDPEKNGDKRLRLQASKEVLALTRVADRDTLWDLPDELTQRPPLEQRAAIAERIRRLQLVEAQLSSGSPQKAQETPEGSASSQGDPKPGKGTAAA